MRAGIALLLCVSSFTLLAQHSTLEPDNPMPRAGQPINLHISVQKKDVSYLNDKNTLTEDEQALLRENIIAGGSLKVNRVQNDTGLVEIGPFTFIIGNERYETERITMRIRPALPETAMEGMWVEVVRFQHYYYVIVEQRIPTVYRRDAKDPNVIRPNTNELTFAELNTEKLLAYGLEFVSSSISTDNEILGKDKSARSVSYKVSSYKFRPLNTLKGSIKLDKSFFTDLPKGVKLQEWVIN